jgi:hypothetical protein
MVYISSTTNIADYAVRLVFKQHNFIYNKMNILSKKRHAK